MRDFRQVAADAKRKAQRANAGNQQRADADVRQDMETEDEGEVVVLSAVRADGRPGLPRAPISGRGETEDAVEEAQDEGDASRSQAGAASGAPPEVEAKLANLKVKEVGGGEMTGYSQEDGEVRAPSKPGQVAVDQGTGDGELADKQNKRLGRAALLLKDAVIKSVEVDLEFGTTTALNVILNGDKTETRIVLDVHETGQLFLKVPK